jgi:hypothetical protein
MLERICRFIDELCSLAVEREWRWQSVALLILESIFIYVCGTHDNDLLKKHRTNGPIQFLALFSYRLTFHPLAKYPGPLISKLSSWSIYFQAASGNRHLESWKEHEVYGTSSLYLKILLSNKND